MFPAQSTPADQREYTSKFFRHNLPRLIKENTPPSVSGTIYPDHSRSIHLQVFVVFAAQSTTAVQRECTYRCLQALQHNLPRPIRENAPTGVCGICGTIYPVRTGRIHLQVFAAQSTPAVRGEYRCLWGLRHNLPRPFRENTPTGVCGVCGTIYPGRSGRIHLQVFVGFAAQSTPAVQGEYTYKCLWGLRHNLPRPFRENTPTGVCRVCGTIYPGRSGRIHLQVFVGFAAQSTPAVQGEYTYRCLWGLRHNLPRPFRENTPTGVCGVCGTIYPCRSGRTHLQVFVGFAAQSTPSVQGEYTYRCLWVCCTIYPVRSGRIHLQVFVGLLHNLPRPFRENTPTGVCGVCHSIVAKQEQGPWIQRLTVHSSALLMWCVFEQDTSSALLQSTQLKK